MNWSWTRNNDHELSHKLVITKCLRSWTGHEQVTNRSHETVTWVTKSNSHEQTVTRLVTNRSQWLDHLNWSWSGLVTNRSKLSHEQVTNRSQTATNRSRTVMNWSQTGHRTGELVMNRSQTGHKSHESHKHGHEQVTNWSWTGHKLVMNRSRTGHEQVTNRSWTGHELVTNRSRTGHEQVTNRSQTGHKQVTNPHFILIGWLHMSPFQMLNFHQSLHSKVCLIIIKVPKAPLHPVPILFVPPISINKLTLTSQQWTVKRCWRGHTCKCKVLCKYGGMNRTFDQCSKHVFIAHHCTVFYACHHADFQLNTDFSAFLQVHKLKRKNKQEPQNKVSCISPFLFTVSLS